MYLSYRERRLLKRLDKAVCRSDPQLASMLAMFDRLGVGEAMPDQEELRRPPGRGRAGLLSRVRVRPARAARDSGGYPTREVS